MDGKILSNNFRKNDYIFILNLRDRIVNPSTTTDVIRETVGDIYEDEGNQHKKYNTIADNQEYMNKLESEGWFLKTYETVKKYVDSYLKSTVGPKITYNLHSQSCPNKEKIAKLLYFCNLKGRDIPLLNINLSDDQSKVVSARKGIVVVNSGPGTGKTTSAVHKAVSLFDEGVIVVSYTNAAVNNFQAKLYELLNDVSEVDKKPGKKIYLCTIDSISGFPFPKNQRADNFDEQVEMAIRDIGVYATVFFNSENNLRYRHIIIDEAQDVSDSRFKLLMTFYKIWKLDSITFIGDPRQRLNSQCGANFQHLLEYGVTKPELNINVIELNLSFRFINPLLLDLCNSLSRLRPSISSQLISGLPMGTSKKIIKYKHIDYAKSKIIELIEKGVHPSQIAVVSPTVKTEHQGSKDLRLLSGFLKTKGINCADSFNSTAVYISSIHSIKGLEFDYVFFIGASDFPTYLNAELSDVNDGMSLNFVANTRAKQELYYVTNESLRPPVGVDDSFTEGGAAVGVYVNKVTYNASIASEYISPEEYRKNENVMRALFKTPRVELDKYQFVAGDKMVQFKYELISSLLMKLGGKTIPMQFDRELPIERKYYVSDRAVGNIYDMKNLKGQLCHFDDQFKVIQSVYQPYSFEDVEKHKIFNILMCSKVSRFESMDRISDAVIKLANLMAKYANIEDPYIQDIFGRKIYASCIHNKKAMLIFTENVYLACYAKKLNPTKKIFMVLLSQGKVYEIAKTLYTEKRYTYMLECLYSLAFHFKLMKSRGKYSVASCDKDNPVYVVDTEYSSRVNDKSHTIYDIAIVNLGDPFSSIFTYLRCDPETFSPMYGDKLLSLVDLQNVPLAEELLGIFENINAGKRPQIYYYSSVFDLALFYEGHERYSKNNEPTKKQKLEKVLSFSNASDDVKNHIRTYFGDDEKLFEQKSLINTNEIKEQYPTFTETDIKLMMSCCVKIVAPDLEFWSYDKSIDYGYDFHNARVTKKGKLSDVYCFETGYNYQEYRHITLHKALDDTLLLCEIVSLRNFSASPN